ncbi:unnamed protein product [Macrosiphum euphorbiae]|uniref:MADF domain-containing protein n=2 Tax=Macrosiphum euphorbiae TaxID=13131 RepID=A0AAV0YAB3_9HEMI|nr:unnamed protein product [Macrosiphum euphorbiae]
MIDTEQFIIEIQQNDCIWNKQERSHHDSQAIHVGWTSVANACVHKFNELVDKQKSEKIKDLKIKWKNIKDNYRKKCMHKSGQAAKSDKPYVYANILEFLRPTMENRNTESNVAVQNDREYTTDNENDISAEANHSGVSEEESPAVHRKKKRLQKILLKTN